MTTMTLLKFPDQATAQSVLAAYFKSGKWITGSHVHALDPIGTLYNDDAVIDPTTGEVTTPATPQPGWHVNFTGDLPSDAAQYKVGPFTPQRAYSGASWAQNAPALVGKVTPGLYVDSAGVMWQVIQPYDTAAYPDPTTIPALVRKLRVPDPDAEWTQPIDQWDAYRVLNPWTGTADVCKHNGKVWRVQSGDAKGYNVWEPGVGPGWVEVIQ